MKIINKVVFAGLLLAFSSASFTAVAAPEDVVKSFSVPDIERILAEKKVTCRVVSDTGRSCKTAVGLIFTYNVAACSKGPCLGLQLFASFSVNADKELSRVEFLDRVHKLNLKYSAVKFMPGDKSETVHLARYVIADGGITEGNIAANFDVMISMASTFYVKWAAAAEQ